MWNPVMILVLCVCSFTHAVPLGLKKNMAIVQQQQEEDPMLMLAADEETNPEMMISRLNLPSNATSIRADITDGFSCDNKTYGYYADVENECQIFHVCLPVTYADGKENTFRWSFICPEETVFSQDSFTCMRPEDMSIDCEESFKYYELNRNFGVVESENIPAEEDMNMEEMSRQPEIQDLEEEDSRDTLITVPVKKQIVKVQNSNRRKTQTNRITIEAQRKKVQPLRKMPQAVQPAAAPAITAKPVEQDVPIVESEPERTTVKYQRFTKRPLTLNKEPPKQEAAKPEQQFVRQDLYTQKRKRPQAFSTTKLETPVEIESQPEPEISKKTNLALPSPAEQSEAQAEAQASEIAEVSIKPQEEKKPMEAERSEPIGAEEKKPAFAYIPYLTYNPKSEIAPIPDSVPAQAEVVEIPIQKVDEPLVAVAPAVVAPAVVAPAVVAPIPVESKPVPDIEESLQAEENNLRNEEIAAKDTIQAELTKTLEEVLKQGEEKLAIDTPAETEKQMEKEKILLEPFPEADKVIEVNEPEKLLEAVKSVELSEEPAESEMASNEDSLPAESEKSAEAAPEDLVPEPDTLIKLEAPLPEPEMEQLKDDEMKLKADIPSPSEAEKILEPVAPVEISMQPEAEPEKPMKAEMPVAEPDLLLKADTPIAVPEKALESEAPAPLPEIALKMESSQPEMLLEAENAAPEAEMAMKIESPVAEAEAEAEPKPETERLAEAELPASDLEMTKSAEISPVNMIPNEMSSDEKSLAEEESLMDLAKKPAELEFPAESVAQEPAMPAEAEQEPEADVNKSADIQSEVEASQSSEQMASPAQTIEENGSVTSAGDNEDAQSLILDFISSLVNSENSNLDQQSETTNEMKMEEAVLEPESVGTESKLSEEKPDEAEIPSEQQQPLPMYNPMMQNNDQMYQIPVQVIESDEPEIPIPVSVQKPKLPLTIDDVVELVKESLDTPAEKENLMQQPSASQPESLPDSEEVKPIYHRYLDLGSNLLKSEALTASDDEEPTIISTSNDDSTAQDDKQDLVAELPKTIETLAEPEKLASEPEPVLNSLPQTAELPIEVPSADIADLTAENLAMSRSMSRFRMDPRKRRFLFRSDAS